jgi:membrane-associated phospholipid phosphatase
MGHTSGPRGYNELGGWATLGMNVVARWLSIVGHPFVMSMVMVLGLALHVSTPTEALRTVLLVAAIALVPVAVLMVRQVRTGSWTNVDASDRAERPLLFGVSITALAILIGLVLAFRPGSVLIRGALSVLIMLVVCAVATRWVKVSLHTAFGALATTTLLSLGSPAGWVLLGLLPALAWSRLALERHRPVEVAAGLFLGIAFGYAITNL